ncbi:HK97-gp10 family putative phage morphogenesis protein [Bacillus seohaeanensis]|uniref:HK97-gp10 family putative phage morphogenesis protein n=1 Tax=Bacillus seohaeanensis TaxID=284580 RepID=A0ABW5RRQ5_9BACI
MGIKLDGMTDILSRIEGMANTQQAKEKALDKGAEHMRKKIADNTNRKRSNLNKEHAADNVIVKKNGDEVEIGYSKDHYYMMFHEFGTSKMSADPTVAPTFENEQAKTQEIMSDAIKKELNL